MVRGCAGFPSHTLPVSYPITLSLEHLNVNFKTECSFIVQKFTNAVQLFTTATVVSSAVASGARRHRGREGASGASGVRKKKTTSVWWPFCTHLKRDIEPGPRGGLSRHTKKMTSASQKKKKKYECLINGGNEASGMASGRGGIGGGIGGEAASSTCAQQGKGLRGEVQARRASEAWAVQGGGKVRDPCVRRAGWLGRAQGGLGRALGAPHVDLVRLAFASRTKRMKVTSTPEVPGPSRSWSPGNVARP